MADDQLHETSSVFKIFKRKVNSAGLRLIHLLEKNFKKWPEQFCLITGAPRSGTTAVESWLNSQEKVTALHETRILIAVHRFLEETNRHKSFWSREKLVSSGRNLAYDFYRSRCTMIENKLLIDKEPLEPIAFPDKNYALFLQNYRLIFPNGKLLFMVRDPFAAIWSMKKRKWGHSLNNYTPRSFPIDTHIQNWCDCADLIFDYAGDENCYVCSFEKLVNNPQAESARIFEFLQLNDGGIFQPRPVKNIRFDEEQRLQIEQKTRVQMNKLRERKLVDI
jgi:hypothetical protein